MAANTEPCSHASPVDWTTLPGDGRGGPQLWFCGLQPPVSAWTITEPSDLIMRRTEEVS
jgi:hypothetical protein